MLWTLVSLAASGHVREGLPQVKKFIWFAMLFVVYNAVRELRHIRGVVIACIAAAALSSAWGLEQFAQKYHAYDAQASCIATSTPTTSPTASLASWESG